MRARRKTRVKGEEKIANKNGREKKGKKLRKKKKKKRKEEAEGIFMEILGKVREKEKKRIDGRAGRREGRGGREMGAREVWEGRGEKNEKKKFSKV